MVGLIDPFKPGTGAMPRSFVGREALLAAVMEEAAPLYHPQEQSPPKRDIIMWGPEGVGKTVLLRRIQDDIEARFNDIRGATVLRWTPATELRSRANAINEILPGGLLDDFRTKFENAKVIRLFGLGIHFGDLAPKTLRYALAARLERGPLVILLDEAQEMTSSMAQELLSSAQLLRTGGAPLLLVLAGTAKLFSILNKGNNAVWKRSALFEVGLLEREHLKLAFRESLPGHVDVVQSALDQLLDKIEGKPYRLQEIGALIVDELRAQEERGDKIGVTDSLAETVQRRLEYLDARRAKASREAQASDIFKIRQQKKMVERLKKRNRKIGCRLAGLNAKAQEISGKLKESALENAQLRGEAVRLAEREKQIATLESEKGKLKAQISRRDTRVQKLVIQNTELRSMNKQLEEKVKQLTDEKEELSTLGEKRSKRITDLDSKSELLRQQIKYREEFYQQKKELRPTRWRWLFGDERPPEPRP